MRVAGRCRRVDGAEGLEQLGDVGTGEPEVAMAALTLDRHEPCIEQARQVLAGRGRRDADQSSQLTARPSPVVDQHGEQRGSRPIRE